MKNANYAPRPLSVSREYPGYQFYAMLRLEGHNAEDCFRYTALTIQNWLCERIKKANGTVPDEIVCPPPASFMNTSEADLRSCKLPFAEIISMPEQGVWALMVREPDLNIAARSFVTHAAVRIKGDKEIEFGTYIDVVDRDPVLPEIDKAYRPQFIRLLFSTEGMILRQATPLVFKKFIDIKDRRGVGRLKELADDRSNQLPLIVFTHAKRVEASPADIERMITDIMKTPQLPEFVISALQPATTNDAATPACEMPYNVVEFADHIYGFAQA